MYAEARRRSGSQVIMMNSIRTGMRDAVMTVTKLGHCLVEGNEGIIKKTGACIKIP